MGIKIKSAYKVCDYCGNYNLKFCANCETEVEHNNRCPECNKFVKVTDCPECNGYPEEFCVDDVCRFYVGKHSIEEHKTLFNFNGNKGKLYNAKVIEIVGPTEVKVRVRGKEFSVSTDDLSL